MIDIVTIIVYIIVNPSAIRLEGRSLLRGDPEQGFFTPPAEAELNAVEWIKNSGGSE